MLNIKDKNPMILILICLITIVIMILLYINLIIDSKIDINNSDTNVEKAEIIDDEKLLEQELIVKFLESDEVTLAVVNNDEVTNRDICLTEKYYPDCENLINQEIENIILLQKAKQGNIVINTENEKYIDEVISNIKNTDYFEKEFYEYDFTKQDYIELNKEYMKNIILINTYKDVIMDNIVNGILETDNASIQSKCEKHKEMLQTWLKSENNESEIYEQIWILRREILNDYIQDEINNSDIKIYHN